MKRQLVLLLATLLTTGCSSVPFEKIPRVSLEKDDPAEVIGKYEQRLPEHYEALSTLLYEYGWNRVSVIGYIDINYSDNSFNAVSINPVGIKLFELTGRDDEVDTVFMVPAFAQKGDLAGAAGKDIRRIYFDLLPPEDAEVKRSKYKLLFRQPVGSGTLEHVFAGPGRVLAEKNYYKNNALNWRVSYYEYQQKNGKLYPGGIIFNNYKYGYSLTIRLKEIMN